MGYIFAPFQEAGDKIGYSALENRSLPANYAQIGLIGAQFRIKFNVKQALIPLNLKRYLREFTDLQGN